MPDLAASIAQLVGRPLRADEPIALAVSGGPDSLALLLLGAGAFGTRVRALTVDHGLRAGSAAEAAGVGEVCARLGVPHAVLRWDGDKPAGNLQAAAREARYRLMGEWCAGEGVAWLATGHQRDDVAETLLLRLARGSGVAGLAAMAPVRPLGAHVTLLRPLLGCSRAELAALVSTAGLRAIEDPSNADPRFDRSRARRLLAGGWPQPERVAAVAAHLAEAEAALAWTADQAWRGRAAVEEGGVTLDAGGLPRELVRRLVLRALAEVVPESAPRGEELDRLIATLQGGGKGTLAGVLASGGARWSFVKARLRRPAAP